MSPYRLLLSQRQRRWLRRFKRLTEALIKYLVIGMGLYYLYSHNPFVLDAAWIIVIIKWA